MSNLAKSTPPHSYTAISAPLTFLLLACVFLFCCCLFVFEVFFFHFSGYFPLMLVMENTTNPSNIPHYLLRGDPFASRLSREADFVAAFYICIIGQSPTQINSFTAGIPQTECRFSRKCLMNVILFILLQAF